MLAGTAGLALWIAVTASVDPAREEAPDYSGLDRSVFVDGCVDEGGAETECHCMFDHISERVPYEQYSEADRESDPDKWPARVRDITAAAVNRCTDG